jgi:hypothetical protein
MDGLKATQACEDGSCADGMHSFFPAIHSQRCGIDRRSQIAELLTGKQCNCELHNNSRGDVQVGIF